MRETLAEALEREHRDIDRGIETFSAEGDVDARAAALSSATASLRRHIYLEEEFVFPPLQASGMTAPVWVMLREHGEMWRTLDAMDAELATGTDLGPVLEHCRALVPMLEAHNAKEEAIVYPQADAALTSAAAADLRAFLESGQMPAGWVCARSIAPPTP